MRLASHGPAWNSARWRSWSTAAAPTSFADTPVTCLELPLDSFGDYRRLHPETSLKIMRNLAAILARRLVLANAKVDLLSAY
ncbi:CRP-like cAMP-binding protein [Bradyrhizobium yuanmingense]|uniref:hypothetical protein n=1 Tax=Bradyrhizobium yuanmingense TaxID=108015 RepID=UPI00351122FA